MSEDHDLTLNGKVYRWSLENRILSWVDPSNNMTPPMKIIHRLNRLFLEQRGESVFQAWGKKHLTDFLSFLEQHGGSKSDYERFGLGFLLEETDADVWKPRSPLNVLGYRVGKNGLDEQARREILRQAYLGELPNVGPPFFMARWGLPGTPNRLRTIIEHICMISSGGGKAGADYSKAMAEWKADLNWLRQIRKEENLEVRKEKYGF